ncbi:MAG: ABC transporter permease [Caldilineae bacterium]|nr:MAG: ABC transporter permease [Caldilineae bacterium]
MNQDAKKLVDSKAVDALLDTLEEGAADKTIIRAGGRALWMARLRGTSTVIAALLIFVGLSLATPLFLKLDNLLLVARQISILQIIAVGMTFLFISREIDLSVGSIYGFLAIVLATLIAKQHINPWVSLAMVVVLGGIIGLVNGVITTRFGIPSFIVTLGGLSILRGGALLLSGGWPIALKLGEDSTFPKLTDGRLFGTVPAQIFWMLGITIVASFVLSKTKFGAHVYATGGNEEAAILTGIATKRVKTISFMLTGALCGIAAGLLLGQVGSGFPLTGQGFELDVIAAVVIGGTPLWGGAGSILGTLLGAAIIGMITNGLVLLGASAYFEPVAKGSIIVLAVLADTLIRRRAR